MTKDHHRSLSRLWLIIICFLMLLPQFISGGVIIGNDTLFHFNRFYDAAMQLRTGHFNYFQTNYGFQQNGRVINAVYGPAFAMLNGALLALTHNWFGYQLLTTFIINLVAGIVMLNLSRQMGACPGVSLLLAVTYLNSGWLPNWEMAQNMSAWGAALAPYLCMVAIQMITDHQKPVSWLKLTLIISITAQIHLLSTAIFVVTLVPFFIAGMVIVDHRWKMFKETLKAVGLTILLSANIWGALLELTTHNRLAKTNPFNLYHNALMISQTSGVRESILLIMVILFGLATLFTLKSPQDGTWLIMLVGLGILLVASTLFPWQSLQSIMPALKRDFQFPARLTTVAYPLLFAGIARLSTQGKWQRWLLIICLLGTLIQASIFNSQAVYQAGRKHVNTTFLVRLKKTASRQDIVTASNSRHFGKLIDEVGKRSPDYLPLLSKSQRNLPLTYQYEILWQAPKFHHQIRSDGALILTWYAKRANKRLVAVIVYQESKVVLNGKVQTHLHRSRLGAPYVTQRTGKNVLVLTFHPTMMTRFLLLIAGLSWLCFGLILLLHVFRRFRPKNSLVPYFGIG